MPSNAQVICPSPNIDPTCRRLYQIHMLYMWRTYAIYVEEFICRTSMVPILKTGVYPFVHSMGNPPSFECYDAHIYIWASTQGRTALFLNNCNSLYIFTFHVGMPHQQVMLMWSQVKKNCTNLSMQPCHLINYAYQS